MYGLIDSTYLDFPANQDNNYLRGLTLRSGLKFTEMARALDRALAGVNAGVDPLMATLLRPPTTSAFAPGNRSGAMRAEWKSEYTVARPQYVEMTSSMLAIDELEIALGFTEDGLNEISLDDFTNQTGALADALDMAARRATLTRFFSAAEVPVARGVAATSPGLAGSGTGGNVFVGTYPDGTPVAGAYTLYYRDTTTNRALVVKTARDALKKWTAGPWDLVASDAFITALKADAAFVSAGSQLIRPADNTAQALVDPAAYLGVFDGDVRVRMALPDFTDDNAALYKTYGAMSPNNPMVWRFDPLRGPDAYVRSRESFPLAESVAMWKWGANIANRTGAAMIAIRPSGNYVAPAITF